MQTLWKERVEWDEAVPDHLYQQCLTWRNQLILLASFPINRCYFKESPVTNFQLHGFSDASEHAYTGVVYIKASYSSGTISVTLVTKVAPYEKRVNFSLELRGALLLAKLIDHVRRALDIPIEQTYA